jgi:hypothetical protein
VLLKPLQRRISASIFERTKAVALARASDVFVADDPVRCVLSAYDTIAVLFVIMVERRIGVF